MATLKYTPLDEIEQIHATLFATFREGICRPLAWRRAQLHQLARMAQDNADAFARAIFADIGKPAQEVYMAEVGPIVERSLISADSLEEWAKPTAVEVPDWQKSWMPVIHKAPRGPTLVIAPWNYPMILSLQALIAAIAAGCPCVVKPSEIAPAYSQLLAELFPRYLDPRAYRVVNGATPEATKLLELRWAQIFYTGNGRVARIIAAAAAKHLTPVSLELGGKSPVIIDPQCDIKLAAKRILWGKACNAGQTCVAPDYVLVTKDKRDELVAAFMEHNAAFFPDGALASASYGRIVTPAHHARLKALLQKTKGTTVMGGKTDGATGFEPTVVVDVEDGDVLLEEEIFGPILPIVALDNIEQMIDFVNSRDHPLSFYAFTDRDDIKQQLLDNTLSGGLFFNDTFQQLAVNELPFSGVGESGYGYQILKFGFDAFTHLRTSLTMPADAENVLAVRYPPYTEASLNFLKGAALLPIPPVGSTETAND